MYKVEEFNSKKIIINSNKEIGIVANSSLFKDGRNQSLFEKIIIDDDSKKITVETKDSEILKIHLFDISFFKIKEEIILKSNKNLLMIPIKRTFLLSDIKNGIAYYYCNGKDMYLLKDIRNNKFLRQKGNKFFKYFETKGTKKQWYTGTTIEPIVL